MIETNQLGPFQLHIQICKEIIKKKVKLTICISYLALILESSSYSNAKNHKYPIDVRDVNLPQKFL